MRSKREFLEEWNRSIARENSEKSLDGEIGTKDFSGTPALYAFVDMDYFALISAIGWTPTSYKGAQVIVPRGFVTDFASVPRLFWSVLPPIGRYGYAAVFHDFAYWQQTTSRAEADRLFRDTMAELKVGSATQGTLYCAVRLFGFWAWRSNATAKSSGERRVLREFPVDLMTRWVEWKMRPGVFA